MPAPPENQPLSGLRVLITRPESQNEVLAQKLEEKGAEVVSHPVIQIVPADNSEQIEYCLGHLHKFAAVILLSQNAARAFAESHAANETSDFVPMIGAIGPRTRDCVESLGYKVEFISEEANSESMAEAIIERHQAGKFLEPVLIPRADRGSDVLSKALLDAGIAPFELAIYRSEDVDEAEPSVLQLIEAGEFDWITVTSSAIAKNVAQLFGHNTGSTKIVSISPRTSQAAREAGLSVSAEATEFNIDGVVEAILRHESNP
jgi:uroporphyrinogen-III synthase